MSTQYRRNERRRTSKHLTVSSKCLAIVLALNENFTEENVGKRSRPTVNGVNGKELLEEFKLRNKKCYWNPALVESIKSLEYKGFVEPATILVVANEIHLENLRTAWVRRVLKSPPGFNVERIGDVNAIEMQVIPQTQFIPLPDALCLIIMDLNNCCVRATLDTIKENLVEWYRAMTMPSDHLIFDTLGNLIHERKVFHSGSGYFVVTPETYRLPVDPNFSFTASWLPYHPMYIPVFPHIQGLAPQHVQHFHLQQYHQHRAAMRSISCQADISNKDRSVIVPDRTTTDNKKAFVKPRLRSQSVREYKNKERGKVHDKATVIDKKEVLKHSMSVRYKNDEVKAVKDINLKSSNINHDKEKGEKEKVSLFSKIFGRNKKKNTLQTSPDKEVEYATFSAQFPPPEWHWYQQQVEKQLRTDEWVSQQVSKSYTLQYLHNMVQADGADFSAESRAVLGKTLTGRGRHVSKENNKIHDMKGHFRRCGSKTKQEKNGLPKENKQGAYVTTSHYEHRQGESLSPVVHDEIYHSFIETRPTGPRHSSPRFYDTISTHQDVMESQDHSSNLDMLENVSCHPLHYHRQPYQARRTDQRNGSVDFDFCQHSDISFEYKGKIPVRNSVCTQSQDSGVNCIGLSESLQNNKQQDSSTHSGQQQNPVLVRNKLDDLEEERSFTDLYNGNLNTTLVSEYRAEAQLPTLYSQCYDSSVNEDVEGMQFVFEAEINHKQPHELVPSLEPKTGQNCPCASKPVFHNGSFDAVNSENSCDTAVTVKNMGNTSQNSENKATSRHSCELSLVDSGFSSPKNAGDKCESARASTTGESCNKRSGEFVKVLPGAPHISLQEKGRLHAEYHHLNSHPQIFSNTNTGGYKCDFKDAERGESHHDLHELQQKHPSPKCFGLNGEFEVVGVL